MATKSGEPQRSRPLDILLLTTGNQSEQPLLLGRAATYLRRQGFTPRLRDLAVQPLGPQRDSTMLVAPLVALGLNSLDQLPMTLDLIQQIAPLLAGHGALCCFGPAVGPATDTLLAAGVHACIRGEWPKALITIAQHLERIPTDAHATGNGINPLTMSYGRALARQKLEGVQTLHYPTKAQSRRELPDVAPARDLMPPLTAYTAPPWATVDMPTPAWGQVVTTHAAATPCAVCPLAPYCQVRRIERRVVLDDIAMLVAMGARHISFADEDFLADYAHSVAIARTLSRLYPGLSFDFRAPVRAILQLSDVVAPLRRYGATGIGLALEETAGIPADEATHGRRQSISLHSLEEALALCSNHGLYVRPVLRQRLHWGELAGIGCIATHPRHKWPSHGTANNAPAPRDGLVSPAIAQQCLEDLGRLPQRKGEHHLLRSMYRRLTSRRPPRRRWQEFTPKCSPEGESILIGGQQIPCCLRS